MKILAVSKSIVNEAIGAQNATPCRASKASSCTACDAGLVDAGLSHERCKIAAYFPNFDFSDRAGDPRLFETSEVPYRLVVESYSLSSQYERLAPCRVPVPVFALAIHGEGFHGQFNRPWLSSKGNLHLCARIPMAAAAASPLFQIIPSLAVARGVAGDLAFKWPNDIVTGNPPRKIGGALSSYLSGDGALLFGIGVNLSRAPKTTTLSGMDAAACFQHALNDEARSRIHRRAAIGVMRRLVEVTGELASSPQKLLGEYRERLIGIGQSVILVDAATRDVVASGVFSGVDDDFTVRLHGHTTRYRHVRLCFGKGGDG